MLLKSIADEMLVNIEETEDEYNFDMPNEEVIFILLDKLIFICFLLYFRLLITD